MKINSLDIETEAVDPAEKLYAALQPWRLRQGRSRITSIAVCRPGFTVDQIVNRGDNTLWLREMIDLLDSVGNDVVYAHNALFDIAFMIAQLQPRRMGAIPDVLKRVKWRDTGLLTKWLINGQQPETMRFSYSLANLVATFLKDDEMTPFFVKMKSQGVSPGDNPEYCEKRGELDAIMTLKLALKLQAHMSKEQRTGFLTEQDCLLPVANSWIMGIRIDREQVRRNDKFFSESKTAIAKKLGLDEGIFTSTKRLPDLLFKEWLLPVISKTPSGNPSCNADTLKLLQYQLNEAGNTEMADKLGLILEAKQYSTLHSKYVKSMIEALEHTGDGYIYASPRIFGTYTGRFTYSSTTNGKDYEDDNAKTKKFKSAIAVHQIPRRDKMVRKSMIAPEGYEIYEADASGQESRLMALRSKDPVMIEIFSKDMNFHSMTGASIIGEDYSDFQVKYKAEGDEGGYYTEQRQLGKLTNLSCNYRIGGKALSQKAFLDYDTFLTVQTGLFLVQTFNRTYKGVPQYWEDVVWESRKQGYTETFGGRRYKLTDWHSHKWITESSAINVPIQGAGADMKEIAIKETFEKVPEALFLLDLHDANFFYVPSVNAVDLHEKLDHTLNTIDYEKYWGFKLEIELPYESKRGKTFAEVK
ncbi:possible DNA polymerase subunit [Xanthomonas phage Xp15]|uniref:Possible DNA polymerase subunit n=1 Tax=Xanthomonas phage Xp15 TaxID=322855 RepID=Q52PS6_9CAUD|nr:possible DNA polymerase subunit [Xanthomonas phage Xp15]AAX84882.1 possible DNA polymerase subunit [Xanthomonas phage Xp15]